MDEPLNNYTVTATDADGNEVFNKEFECLAVNLDTQNGWITYVPAEESAVGFRILDNWAEFQIVENTPTETPVEATTTEAVAS